MRSGYSSHNTWIKRTLNPLFRKFGFSIVSVIREDGTFDRYALRRYPKYCDIVDNGINPADDWEDVWEPAIGNFTNFEFPCIRAVMPALIPVADRIREEIDNRIVEDIQDKASNT